MINIIVNLILVVCFFVLNNKNYKNAIVLYVIGTFIAPVLKVGSIELSFDIWFFPVMFLSYAVKKKGALFNLKLKSLLPYLFIYIIIVAYSAIVYDGGISVASIYAILRFIFMINIINDAWGDNLIKFLDGVLAPIIMVNVVCCAVQMLNVVSVEFFYELYYKSSMIPLSSQVELGYFNRAYGTTGSPVILGTVSALSYAFYLPTYLTSNKNVRFGLIKLLLCTVCGLLALSKTAILAIPILTVCVFALLIFTGDKRNVKPILKFALLIAVGFFALLVLVVWMEREEFAISYYLEFLKNPLEALSTRYDTDSGILAETMEVIKGHFVFGVGNAKLNNAFVGDSVYVVLLYETGIIGLLAYLLPYVAALIKSILKKDLIKASLLITFFMVSVGNAMHFSCFVIPFAVLMLTIGVLDTKKAVGFN